MGRPAKVKDQVNTADSYRLYLEKSGEPVSKSIYLKICNGFFKYLMEMVMEGYQVKLPWGMGLLYIRGVKVKPRIDENGNIRGLSPNWAATKKLRDSNPEAKARRQVVYNLNEHTNGLKYNIQWSKKNVYVPNISFYSLRITRTQRRTASALFKAGKEYIVEKR